MSRTTWGIIAGVIGTALAALWWKQRRPADVIRRSVQTSATVRGSMDPRPSITEGIDLTGYARLAEGII